MKIIQYGTVTFVEGRGPVIENWNVEREDTDPADATTEQLLLGFAIYWAQNKFKEAMKSTAMQYFRDMAAKAAASQKPS